MLVTVSGIGTAQMSSTVKSLGGDSGAGGSIATPDATAGTGTVAANGIDMLPIEERSFDVGTAGNGTRYFYTTFTVRNARFCGSPGMCAPYAATRHNLTLVPMATSGTMTTTPFVQFTTAGGTAALPSYATETLPTHGMALTSAGTAAVKPGLESLQLFGENEIAAWPTVAGATTAFPYGFVVHSESTDASRALAGSPGDGDFDGLVTMAFKMPLAATPSQNPTTVSFVVAAVDDANTRVSQSAEEASVAGDAAAAKRAQALAATDVATVGSRTANTAAGDPMCSVRSAGTASVPYAYVVGPNSDAAKANLVKAAPSALALAPLASLRLGFCQPMAKPTPATLVVSGSISGTRTAVSTAGTSVAGWSLDRTNQLLVTPATAAALRAGRDGELHAARHAGDGRRRHRRQRVSSAATWSAAWRPRRARFPPVTDYPVSKHQRHQHRHRAGRCRGGRFQRRRRARHRHCRRQLEQQ